MKGIERNLKNKNDDKKRTPDHVDILLQLTVAQVLGIQSLSNIKINDKLG